MNLTNLDMMFPLHPEANIFTGGQPSVRDLEAFASEGGVTKVINLRMPAENTAYDEPAEAARLGLHYVSIPVGGPAGVNLDNAKKLDAALEANSEATTLVHCGSGNRVGALYALRAFHLQGQSAADAMEVGSRHGLTGMAPLVQNLLR